VNCIDLKAKFSKRYRIVSEDGNARNTDPWLWTMPCKHGHIYPHGGERLGAATDKRGPLIRKLASIPSAVVEQLGDDGANISFDVADFKAVAAIMRPKRRRQLTAEQKAKLLASSRPFQKKDVARASQNELGPHVAV
jgi:hypothetical protein